MRVVCIGECMVEFARQDDGLWRQGFAGDTLNVAWALRALLPTSASVDYLTRVGRDALSDAMVAMIAGAGIGTAHVGRDDTRTVGLYTIETDARGERSFAYWRGASAAKRLAEDAEALGAALQGADLVYVSGITLAILSPEDRARLMTILGAGTARGFRVAFDPNIRPRLWEDMATARVAIMAMAARADSVLPTHDDEAMAFGDANAEATRARYRALGVREVIVKDGTRPTLWALDGATGGGEAGAVPVMPASRVIDTTGAGDSFNGGYLAARLSGASPEAAIAQAQLVSARVVGHRGALLPFDQLRA